MCARMVLFSVTNLQSLSRKRPDWLTHVSSPALPVIVIPLIIIDARGVNLLVQAAIKDEFHKQLKCGMSVFILYLNQNGNEE